MGLLLFGLPVLAYFYGAVPFGFLAAKLIRGVDIRERGSGNIGATNAARVLGFRYFPLVFVLDFSKGFLPVLAAVLLLKGAGGYRPHPLIVLTALAAIVGHVFPVYLGFKGGKAVATGTGAFAVLAPVAILAAFVVWMVAFLIWRYVSLASISAAGALAICVWLVQDEPAGAGIFLSLFATAGAILIIALHRSNIGRLLRGTEHKIGRPRPQVHRGPPPPGGED